jgi:thiol-disulfide isomerase/thioredoxin
MKICLFIILIICCHSQDKSLVVEINDINYLKTYLNQKQKAMIEVYAPGCPHCAEFAPAFNELAKTVNFNNC